MMRAYALLEVKALDLERRTIRGIASTPTPDRGGDIFEPRGATFAPEIPLLLHHDTQRPIGRARLTATEDALLFEADLAQIEAPGALRDRLEEVWQTLQAGLLRGVSIGFRPLRDGAKALERGARHFLKTEVCELSLVTVPQHQDATILTVKSADAPYVPTSPARAGLPEKRIMTTAEQITTFENKRAAHAARMTALMQKAADAQATLADDESTEYDDLDGQVKTIDGHLVRLRALEKTLAASAVPVPTGPSSLVRPVIQIRPNVEPGTAFVRYCKAWAAARGDTMSALAYAEQWKDTTPEVALYIKAAVAPATTTDATWAKPLVPAFQTIGSEFIDLLRPATLLGRIPGLNAVPFNVAVAAQTAGSLPQWVGEGAPKPVGKLAFGTVTLPQYKLAVILTFTEELARNSSPRAEDVFRRSMIRDISQFMDTSFVDPAITLIAGVRPASITNGVTGIPATANPLVDITNLLKTFITAKIPITGVVLLMSETNAFILSAQRNALGEPNFPSVAASGGSINGIPVITSEAVGTNIIALVPQYILFADDGGVTIDLSREASLQMADNPMNPADATTVFTSLWQNNLVGLRAERYVAWIKSIAGCVNMITGAAYTPTLAEAPLP